MTSRLLPETKLVRFGKQGGLIEILYAATGFLHVRREVYERMRLQLELPTCHRHSQHPVVPYFLPLVVPQGDDHAYLSEDFSFCERARRAGYKIMADTSLRLWHIGAYRFSWEEAALGIPRFDDVVMEFLPDGSSVLQGHLPAAGPAKGQ
jgi:hypothetical protein